jgi:molybdopterin converting factor small subunit
LSTAHFPYLPPKTPNVRPEDARVTVEVRFFASLAECAGLSTETLEIEPLLDVAGLWQLLVERHSRLGQLGYHPLVACDRVYADWDRTLDGVREVAFLPPVSGG